MSPRPTLEVADIFRQYGPAYRQAHPLPLHQHRLMQAIEACRTPVLGGVLEWCGHCQYTHIQYRSCRNRHCPKCQGLARAKWLQQRTTELLPVEYFHVVFTLPEPLAAIAFQNKEVVYDIFFRATAETLLTLARDPKHLGAEIGSFAVLHTWGQNLHFHPHLQLEALRDPHAFARYLGPVRDTEWVVYAKPPFGGPQHVLEYLGRYTHRVAISNQRLLGLQEGQVSFRWKDYRHPQRPKVMTVAAQEFIRRFLLHALPPGFQRIRYYGFLANCHRAGKLDFCRQCLATPCSGLLPQAADVCQLQAILSGHNLRRCPQCGIGALHQIAILFPGHGPLPLRVDTA